MIKESATCLNEKSVLKVQKNILKADIIINNSFTAIAYLDLFNDEYTDEDFEEIDNISSDIFKKFNIAMENIRQAENLLNILRDRVSESSNTAVYK